MRRITQKLWLGMVAMVLFMLSLLWIFQIVFFESGYLSRKVVELERRAQTLAGYINANDHNTDEYIEQIDAYYNADTVILDSFGRVAYVSPAISVPILRDCMENSLKIVAGSVYRDYVKFDKLELTYVRVGLHLNSGGSLFLLLPVADVSETVSILKRQYIALSVILLIASVVVASILSLFFSRPIKRLETQAQAMARGDLVTPFVAVSRDEIGALSHTMEFLRLSLQQVEKLRQEFIANVSHELRTPLAVIRGFAEMVRDVTWKNDHKREQQLSAIIEESERLNKIVEDILDYSQMQSGNVRLMLAPFDMAELTCRVGERMRDYIQKSGVKLSLDVPDEAMVYGEERKLEQVLINLLGNAFNHSPKDTTISLRVSIHESTVKVEVADEGEGIPAEDLPYIYERYYRAALREREERIGTGLGLAIVRSILLEHHSDCHAKSSLGSGSVFWFELPLLPQDGRT